MNTDKINELQRLLNVFFSEDKVVKKLVGLRYGNPPIMPAIAQLIQADPPTQEEGLDALISFFSRRKLYPPNYTVKIDEVDGEYEICFSGKWKTRTNE